MLIVPPRLVFAVAVEHLHAMVFSVGDTDKNVGVGGDVMHNVELAGIGAGLAPAHDQFAIRAEHVDAGVAIAVGNMDLALRRQRRVGAAVERLAAHVRRGLLREMPIVSSTLPSALHLRTVWSPSSVQ
jgi:hypothetical protein